MPPVEKIAALIVGRFRDELDEPDSLELDEWIAASEDNRAFVEELSNASILSGKLKMFREGNTGGIWQRVKDKMPEHDFRPAAGEWQGAIGWRPPWWKYAVAASLILMLSAGLYYWWQRPAMGPQVAKTVNQPVETIDKGLANPGIVPGGYKAILTLADGSGIDLNTIKGGFLASQGGVSIQKTGEGELSYAQDVHAKNIGDNTLSTPRGGLYKLVLPDGTKVMLNAASSLSYPNAFDGKSRMVRLKGEAYFEVVPDKSKPFIVDCLPASGKAGGTGVVNTPGWQIEALGTRFSVSAYANERVKKAALFEGVVRITAGEEQALLKPGKEAISEPGSPVRIVKAPTEADSWMKGFFNLEGEDLQSLLGEVSRWYNVEIELKGELPSMQLTGSIARGLAIDKLLEILKSQGEGRFDFKFEKSKIIITGQQPKN